MVLLIIFTKYIIPISFNQYPFSPPIFVVYCQSILHYFYFLFFFALLSTFNSIGLFILFYIKKKHIVHKVFFLFFYFVFLPLIVMMMTMMPMRISMFRLSNRLFRLNIFCNICFCTRTGKPICFHWFSKCLP
jgi:hypothetical protein